MKKLLAFISAAAMMLSLSSCSSSAPSGYDNSSAQSSDSLSSVSSDTSTDVPAPKAPSDDFASGTHSINYKGITMDVPANWTSEAKGDTQYFYFDGGVLTVQKSEYGFNSSIQSPDAVESMIDGAVEMFDEFSSNPESSYITVGRNSIDAVSITFLGKLSSRQVSSSFVVFMDESYDLYSFVIIEDTNSVYSHSNDYEKILSSIEFASSSSANTEDNASEVEDNILVRTVATSDGSTCVFLTNQNSIVIPDVDVQINYLSSDGTVVDSEKDTHDVVLPGYTVVSALHAPKEYDHTEVIIQTDIECNQWYVNHSNSCTVSTNAGDNCVIVQIKNDSSVEIQEFEYVVVFYDGDKISHVSNCHDVYDVPSGTTITEKESTYGIGFDHWEVYLNQAHTFEKGISPDKDTTDNSNALPAVGKIKKQKVSKSVSSSDTSSSSEIIQDYGEEESSSYEPTTGEYNALRKAHDYLNLMAFSRSGLIEQLEFEGYSHDESVYAADNCGANWKKQAVKKAKEYLDLMAFSRSRLIEQLEYDGFTHKQAVYGAKKNGY